MTAATGTKTTIKQAVPKSSKHHPKDLGSIDLDKSDETPRTQKDGTFKSRQCLTDASTSATQTYQSGQAAD